MIASYAFRACAAEAASARRRVLQVRDLPATSLKTRSATVALAVQLTVPIIRVRPCLPGEQNKKSPSKK